MKKKLLYLLFFIAGINISAQSTVPIEDENFEQALIDLGWDSNGLNGNLLLSDATKIDQLIIYNPTNVVNPEIPLNPLLNNVKGKIRDISAIKYMPNLTYLYAGYNEIESVDVSQNPILAYLDLRVNDLTEIDVRKNQYLSVLNVAFNNLTNLDVTNNFRLIVLAIYSNSIRDVDVRSNYQLTQLSVGINPMPYINVLNNPKLIDLDISYTLVKEVNFSKNPLLKRLRLIQTNLETLELESNPLLTRIDFFNNPNISELNLINQQNLDTLYISNNAKLAALNLKNGANTKILSFASLQNPKLTCINVDDVNYATTNWVVKDPTASFDSNCYNNSPPIASNLTFTSLIESGGSCKDPYIRSNNLSYTFSDEDNDKEKGTIITWFISDNNEGTNKTEISSAKNKTSTNISYPGRGDYYISFDVTPTDGMDYGEKVESEIFGPFSDPNNYIDPKECKEEEIIKIYDSNFEQELIDLGYDNKIDGEVLKDSIVNINKLNLDNKNISDLATISSFTSLDTLICSNNNLSGILKLPTNLKFLSAENNSIENLEFSYSSNLQTINLSNNKIKVLDLSGFKDLTQFSAADNSLQALKLDNENNTNLTLFDVRNNPSLKCVQVDDFIYSTNNWKNIDDSSLYSEMCSSSPPTVTNLQINGELIQYEEITASYEYLDTDDYEEYGTKIEWFVSDDEYGRNITPIDWRRDGSFTQVFRFYEVNKYISFKITPGNGFTYGTPVMISYFGPIQASTTANNTPPVVTSLQLYGQFYAGKTIAAIYNYSDNDDDSETESLYSWYLSDDENGTNKERIEEVTGKNYLLSSNDVGKYLSFEITPFDGTDYGLNVESNLIGPIEVNNNPPTVSNLIVSGDLDIGDVLTASYDYTDEENDEEIGSIYQWFISDDEEGTNKTQISGANDIAFTITEAEQGMFISFKVTPYDGIGIGESIESNLQGPIQIINNKPTVSNLDISGELKIGNTLTATYDYSDLENHQETGSIYQWYTSDDLDRTNKTAIKDATNLTYVLTEAEQNKYISFMVTPYDGNRFGNSVESNLLGPIEPTIEIPDANFEQALIDLGFDTNGLNGNILLSDADKIETLRISNPLENTNLPNVNSKISNITGISSFANLKSLYCSHNSIGTIDLSKNTYLKVLDCRENNLVYVNVANGNNTNVTYFQTINNPNLTCIQVDNQQFSLDNWIFTDQQTGFSEDCSLGDVVSNYYTAVPDNDFEQVLINYKIDDVIDGKFITENAYYTTELSTDWNNLAPKNLKGIEAFKSLKKLQSAGNNLEKLDLSQNVKLEELVLDGKIDTLNLKKLINLKKISADGAGIKYIYLKDAVNLEYLYLPNNSLESIDVTKNIKLTYISVVKNKLKSLDVLKNTLLEKLGCYDNEIEYLDLSKSKNLIELVTHRNNLGYLNMKNGNNKRMSSFAAFNNPNLSCIQVDDAKWSTDVMSKDIDDTASFSEDCSNVWQVYTEDENLKKALASISNLDLDDNGEITYAEAQAFIGDLDLSYQNITNPTGLEAFSNAESINISGNNITDISNLLNNSGVIVSSKTTGEKKIFARNNSISIKKLDASNNLIEAVDISKITSITELNISNNKLTYLNINNDTNTTLIILNATGNPKLGCIQVDDLAVANSKENWKKDATASYNTFCKESVLSNEDFLIESISIYPNPAKTFVEVELVNRLQLKSVEIYNLLGKKFIKTNKSFIDINNLTNGIYFMKVYTDKGSVNKRFIKK